MTKKKPAKRKFRTDDELKQLAKDIKGNLIYMGQFARGKVELPMIFLPLALLNKKDSAMLSKAAKQGEVAEIFEYYSKAGTWAVNGQPTFTSFQTISKEELEKVNAYLKALDEAEKTALAKV